MEVAGSRVVEEEIRVVEVEIRVEEAEEIREVVVAGEVVEVAVQAALEAAVGVVEARGVHRSEVCRLPARNHRAASRAAQVPNRHRGVEVVVVVEADEVAQGAA